MKRLAAFLVLLLAGSLVPVGMVKADEVSPVATFHIVANHPQSFRVGEAEIYWDGIFQYSSFDGWSALFHVVYLDGSGVNHSVVVSTRGTIGPEKRYIWILTDYNLSDAPQEKQLGLFESWKGLTVQLIDPIGQKVVIQNDRSGETFTLYVGDEKDLSNSLGNGENKIVLELKDITTTLAGSKADLVLHNYTITTATVELYKYQNISEAPEQNQTNTTPTPQQPLLDPTKVPAVMIIVGEHAAGADVAAGAKVGIAVQKWIDESDSLIEWLPLPSTVVKAYKEAKKTFIRADAMLDTEVTDPNKIAPIVYSVGGPAANEYSAMLNNRTDLPVRFVKEDGKWYLVSKYGDKWSGSYGVIEIIPAFRTPEEMKEHLMNGDFKLYDVLVAGLDRKGTYAACKLLNANFMGMLKGEKPDPRLINLISLQAQLTTLFTLNPYVEQVPATAIIVDQDGRIVKVISG